MKYVMEQPVKLGVIGCGRVFRGPYLSLIQPLRTRGLVGDIVACDSNPAVGGVVAGEPGVAAFTTDHREVLDDPEVDVVLVLTSMPEHGSIAKDALLAGKHVLVEKPMAITLPEAAELVELARTSAGHLVCAPFVILSPTFQAMWRHVTAGDIGRPTLARGRYGWAGPDWGPWFYQAGGGPLFDLGVYNVTALTGLLGPVRRVSAFAGRVHPQRVVDGQLIDVETEDNFQILLDFDNSVFATVTTGFSMQKYRSPALEIYGTEGTIQMLGDDWAPEGHELWQNSEGAWKLYGSPNPSWPWTSGLEHLIESIAAGTRPLVTPEHAYHVLDIMLNAIESGRDGTHHLVESTFAPLSFADGDPGEAAHRVHDRTHAS
ncbi:Gfo/Idh/MocA family protein [Actinopolymorpha alba]|uniref:Gfo/Idh/MocA family protein n=1 Tax=Actinopolymorpha alba TaxID=533267 RepID=UPI00037B9BE6|nr:Gfo/Idh/MocA family oxidoreductase [Actinopolymorpha alba]